MWLERSHGRTAAICSDRLQLGESAAVLREKVLPQFDNFVSAMAEEVVRDVLCETKERRRVPFEPAFRGRYWGPEAELDVVLLDSARRHAFIAEVKWTKQPVSSALLDDLRARVAKVKELAGLEKSYALVASAGFRPSQRRIGAGEHLIDLRKVSYD